MTVKITWLGHAAFLFDFDGFQVLTDPYLNGNPAAALKHAELAPDLILVSHGHHDHVGDTAALAEKFDIPVISNPEICGWLEGHGVRKTLPLYISGERRTEFGSVKAVSAVHGSSMPDGSYGGLALGFVLTDKDDRRIYFAGDTGLFGDMALIGERLIDVAILPIGGIYTMGPEDSIRALRLIHPRMVIPMHFNTWDTIRQDIAVWECEVKRQVSAEPVVLKPGESFEF